MRRLATLGQFRQSLLGAVARSSTTGRLGFCTATTADLPAPLPISKLQIIVGRVVEASHEEGSEKLIRETVDVGEGEHRTILSGLAAFTTPEKLEGQLVCVVANLKARPMGPAKTKSHGMLLCAAGADSVEIIQPPAGALPGAAIFFHGVDTVPAPPNRVQKKKLFEAAAVDLATGPDCEALYRDLPFLVMVNDEDSGASVVRHCHAATLSNSPIS